MDLKEIMIMHGRYSEWGSIVLSLIHSLMIKEEDRFCGSGKRIACSGAITDVRMASLGIRNILTNGN